MIDSQLVKKLLTGVLLIYSLGNVLLTATSVGDENRPLPGTVNTEFSRVYIFVDKTGIVGHQHAIEGKLHPSTLFLKSGKAGLLEFNMTSFDADTSLARKYLNLEGETDASTREQVNSNMRGQAILNVARFPRAKLDHVSIVPMTSASKGRVPEYKMIGDFTLHDRTRPIEVVCEVEEKDGWHHLRGSFKINQSDYGIKPFSKMMGAVGVTDQLVIYGDIWAVPE